MRRTLLFLLVVIVVAGVIGTLAERDPGYVLLSYDGTTLQTSLWLFLAVLAGTGFGVVWLLRVWRSIFNTAGKFQRWQKDRALSRSIEHTSRGLLFLQEGSFDRAEKFLKSGLSHQPQPTINYLYLAKAANSQDKAEDREKYLRLALEADAGAIAAVSIMRAELALERKDFSDCLQALSGVSDSNRVLKLKLEAFKCLGNFTELEKLLPKLKKLLSETEYQNLETELVLSGISSEQATEEQRLGVYRSASEAVRQNPSVVVSLCQHVNAEKELEAIVRKLLKQAWHPELVELYGELGESLVQKRLKIAQGWLDQHPLDPALQYCLGYLFERNGDLDLAKDAYQKAVDQGSHKRASQKLAALYADKGDFKQSSEILNLAYRGA